MHMGDQLNTWEIPMPKLTTTAEAGSNLSFVLDLTDENFREDLSGRVIAKKDDNSDINLIESRNKVLVCLSCPLTNQKKDFRTLDGRTMTAHLWEHKNAGQKVPATTLVLMMLRGADEERGFTPI
jgi:hypothetical protein